MEHLGPKFLFLGSSWGYEIEEQKIVFGGLAPADLYLRVYPDQGLARVLSA